MTIISLLDQSIQMIIIPLSTLYPPEIINKLKRSASQISNLSKGISQVGLKTQLCEEILSMVAEIDPEKVKKYDQLIMPSFRVSVENSELEETLSQISLSNDSDGLQIYGG